MIYLVWDLRKFNVQEPAGLNPIFDFLKITCGPVAPNLVLYAILALVITWILILLTSLNLARTFSILANSSSFEGSLTGRAEIIFFKDLSDLTHLQSNIYYHNKIRRIKK